jgi:hypothetical protein
MTMSCPRRHESGIDSWNLREEGRRHCSYCGSLHPDDALARLARGDKATPTDKNYKLYIGGEKFYFQHFDEHHKKAFIDLANKPVSEGGMEIAFPGYFYVLPFFLSQKDGA